MPWLVQLLYLASVPQEVNSKGVSIKEELGMNLLAAEHVCLSLGFEQEWKQEYFRQLHSVTLAKSCLSDEVIYIVIHHSFSESLSFMG